MNAKFLSTALLATLLPLASANLPAMAGNATYAITIKTGDVWGAGTDSDVRVRVIGEASNPRLAGPRTQDFLLDKSGYNDFERGDHDTYHVTGVDVGNITHVLVSVGSSGWFMDSISVSKNNNRSTYWKASPKTWFNVDSTVTSNDRVRVVGSLTKQFKMDKKVINHRW